MEKEYKFIMTESVEKIINQVQRVVSKDEWMAVFGNFGMGKTEVKNYLISQWSRKTDNVVIQFPTFESSNSRIGHIMTWMLRQLNPGEHVPANVELKAEKLRTSLMRAKNQKRKVILILEDVGSIHPKTFKELKKIHELTGLGEKNLFSILMFGNESRVTFSVLSSPEIGLRCKLAKMDFLTEPEMVQFAGSRFGLEFPKGKEGILVKQRFYNLVERTPLGIRYFAEKLFDLPDFSGEITISSLLKAKMYEMKILKERVKKQDISYEEIVTEGKKMGFGFSRDTVKGVLNETAKYKSQTVDEVIFSVESITSKKVANA